jgi:hypothetical protein
MFWRFLVDPYSRYLKPQIAIKGGPTNGDGSMSFHANRMLNFFSPGAENCEAREFVYQDFLKIRDQEHPYNYKYMSAPSDTVAYADALMAEKTLTMEHVVDWVDKWKRHPGRLRFFADLPPTPYFICVAKPLLSMKTTGSISVERAAKPLKNKVAEKSRNRNSKDKRTVLLRVGLNLRLKRESLQAMKAALGKSLDPLVYE